MEFNPLLVSQNIATQRQNKHFTQKELATLIHIKPSTLSDIECGREVPSIKVLNNISNILGITMDSLLEGNIEFLKKDNFLDTNNEIHVKFFEKLISISTKQKVLLRETIEDYLNISK